MVIAGIVAEYNPFHNGHEWHIRRTREKLGEDAVIVCCMSGDFVQRGEAAAYSKFARAEAAARCGVEWVERVWRKRDGFKRSVAESKRLGLYRQNYCGCIFSMRNAPVTEVK